ncbi:MAG: MYXO-CTERM sorting domain-containing protein, partial [Myxococcales bacterium]|nr:MYXO-CTERM sorting domain-containing protein [Myxococcales bacterium]
LNVADGTMAGAMGSTGWDHARALVGGDIGLFDFDVGFTMAEDLTHMGLAVFGDALPAPGEQRLLIQYGPCTKDNLAWALDPQSSCVRPGCQNPWGGAPIAWTFKDGSEDPPGFEQATFSHMPRCEGQGPCAGSGAYLHLGLQLIQQNQIDYHLGGQQPWADYETAPSTRYFNLLITRGRYDGYSTDAQVQSALEAMFSNGIVTYVIAVGDGSDGPQATAQLQSMAQWGSGGANDYYDADSLDALEQTLLEIYESTPFDPCCAFEDCSFNTDEGPWETDSESTNETDSTEGTTETDSTETDSTESDSTESTSESGSTESDSTVGNDEIAGTEADDAVDIPLDEGCNCSSSEGARERRSGIWLGLALIALFRRRRR